MQFATSTIYNQQNLPGGRTNIMKNRYVIAKGYSLEEMAQQVNEYAAQGYAPHGELINRRTLDGDRIARRIEYMQPMWLSGKNKATSNLYNCLTNPALSEPLENDYEVRMIVPAQPIGNVPSEHAIKRPQAIPEWQECEREYVEEIDRLNERIQVLTIDHSIMLNVSAEQKQKVTLLESERNLYKNWLAGRDVEIKQMDGQINTLTAELLAAKERISELDSALHNMAKLAANSTTKP